MKNINENHKILEFAINQAQNSIVITNRDGNILFANDYVCKLTGYARQELIGENPRVLKSGKHPESVYEEMWNTILKKEKWKGKIINKKKNGELYHEILTISPFEYDGELYFIGIQQDVTEEEKIKNQIKKTTEEFLKFTQEMK
jgi:PAS domain S-box-containing protein